MRWDVWIWRGADGGLRCEVEADTHAGAVRRWLDGLTPYGVAEAVNRIVAVRQSDSAATRQMSAEERRTRLELVYVGFRPWGRS